MYKILSTFIFLISPIFAALGFATVGDTIIHDNVRYVITTDSDDAREVEIAQIPIRQNIIFPPSVQHNGQAYNIISVSSASFPSSADKENPARVNMMDFSQALYITGFPNITIKNLEVDSLLLPPNINIFYGFKNQDVEPLGKLPNSGVRRVFSTGKQLKHIDCKETVGTIEFDFSGSSIDSLKLSSFMDCHSLEKLRLPECVTYIGSYTFMNCINLRDMNMPKSLKRLCENSFFYTVNLDSIVIPSKVNYINNAFCRGAFNLKKIIVDPDNKYYQSIDDVLYSKAYNVLMLIPASLQRDRLIIQEGTEGIVADVCSSYTYTETPDYLSNKDGFFRHIVFNDDLLYLENSAFTITQIKVFENFGNTKVETIPQSCFSSSLMQGIEIPKGVKKIEQFAFFSCKELDTINFLGNMLDSVMDNAFAECHSLKELDLSGQKDLQSVSKSMCYNDSSLRILRLPRSIEMIGEKSFANCVSLEYFDIPVANPIDIDQNVFGGVDKSKCRLVVPAQSIEKYKAAPVWKEFANIEAGRFVALSVVCDSAMGEVYGSGVFLPGETASISATPASGYKFIGWDDAPDIKDTQRTITVTCDTVITALFELDPDYEYLIMVKSNERKMGDVRQSAPFAKYNETVTLTAVPFDDYLFRHWSDGSTSNPYTITVTQDTAFIAYFEKKQLCGIVVKSDNLDMGKVVGYGAYREDTVIEIEAFPNDGYTFVEWRDNADNAYTSNPLSVRVVSDSTFTAYFRPDGTGVENLADGVVIEVSHDGFLTVNGCDGCPMSVYTVTGVMLYSGETKCYALPSRGVYIVQLDGKTHKTVWR